MKKLDKYEKLVKKIKGDLSLLKNYGFKRKTVKNSVTGFIYVHPKTKVVIKCCYISTPHKRTPKEAIITKVIKLTNGCDPIFIQPLARVSRRDQKMAMELFETKLSWRDYMTLEDTFDFHDGNVAMYNKQPVMIDW